MTDANSITLSTSTNTETFGTASLYGTLDQLGYPVTPAIVAAYKSGATRLYCVTFGWIEKHVLCTYDLVQQLDFGNATVFDLESGDWKVLHDWIVTETELVAEF
tara:strand:- start:41787 stop:42098 length:312 start_codon:yes stop_codon:yes gene_type:complete